ncbi:MAG: hypothetical protein KBC42_01660 [Candidatus Pacebacteria bacterium]|nr:hypothetical protein [Candidatus Paceibacterota bacterium]MBP9780612.1 hypothetical protein [Candidatus Paceibacterota bacterium]
MALIVGFILGGLFPVDNYLNSQKATSLDSEFAEKSLNENGRAHTSINDLNNTEPTPNSNYPYPYMCGDEPMIFDLPDINPQNEITYITQGGLSITCFLMAARVAKEITDEVLVEDLSVVGKLNSSTQPNPSPEKKYKCTSQYGSSNIEDFPFNYQSFSYTILYQAYSVTWNCEAI